MLPTLHTRHNFTAKEIVRVIIITANCFVFFISIQLISVPLALALLHRISVIISCLYKMYAYASMHAPIHLPYPKKNEIVSKFLDLTMQVTPFCPLGLLCLSHSYTNTCIHSQRTEMPFIFENYFSSFVRIISETNLHYLSRKDPQL